MSGTIVVSLPACLTCGSVPGTPGDYQKLLRTQVTGSDVRQTVRRTCAGYVRGSPHHTPRSDQKVTQVTALDGG